MECNSGQDAIFFNSFGIALLFRYIHKGLLVKISENIAFLFYKEIYMKYLILYYKTEILSEVTLKTISIGILFIHMDGAKYFPHQLHAQCHQTVGMTVMYLKILSVSILISFS